MNPPPIQVSTNKTNVLLPTKKKKTFWQGLTKNVTSKIVSLIIAILLYYHAHYGSNVSRNVQIPIIPPKLQGELIFSSKLPAFLKVTLTGHNDLMDFSLSGFQIILENPNPILGTNIYRVNLYPEPPQGVVANYTKKLEFFIDRMILREVSVVPKVRVKLKKGRYLGYVSSTPRSVILKGPYETLASMSQVETEEVKIEEEEGEVISRQALIKKLPDFVTFADNQPFEVQLSVNLLNNKNNYKTIKNIPIRCINKTPGIKMSLTGKGVVDLIIDNNLKPRNYNPFRAFVFCPVFYDLVAKAIRPAFIIQNQPVFSYDKNGLENPQVLKISPSYVNLQFEQQ